MTNHDQDASFDASTDTAGSGRRAFMAGAAGLAAGAALLGGSTPAGALGTTGEYDLPLQYVDLGTGDLTPVDLGTGGFAKIILSAFGDMAAGAIRIKVGAGADTGDGPWAVDGGDLPSGFQPVPSPNDMTPTGTSAWGGMGQVLDFTKVNGNAVVIGCGWSNFSNTGGSSAVLVWSLPDVHNDGSGNVLFNYGGVVPYGAPLGEGALVYSAITYLVNLPAPVEE